MHEMKSIFWMVLLLPLLSGCTLTKKQKWERKISQADEAASALVEAVDVPKIRYKGHGPVEPATRISLGPDGLRVDNAAFLHELWQQGLPEAVRDLDDDFIDAHLKESRRILSLKGGIIPPSVLRDGEGGYFIEPLYQVLSDAMTVEKSLRMLTGESSPAGQLLIYVDKKTTYDIVSRVVYTAGQAEYGRIGFVVKSPEGPRVLFLDQPRFCTEQDPVPGEDGDCAEPYLAITAQGIVVWATGGSPDPKCRPVMKPWPKTLVPAEPGPPEEEAQGGASSAGKDWRGRIMLGPDMVCPSVPRKDGRIDPKALESLLLEVKKMAPGCKRAAISPQPHIVWSEIVMVMDSLTGPCGFSLVQLHAGNDEDVSGCPNAMRPGG